jgi:S1-C subfamily serine protease
MDAKRGAVEQLLVRARAPRQRHVWAVHAHPEHNVVGVGIGRKIKRGRPTRTRCVRIYVERKIPRDTLPPELILPKRFGDVVTDVIETGRLRAYVPGMTAGQKRLRPARPGCSIGFQFADSQVGPVIMAGTLGALVEADGTRYILSNNHVLANENLLPVGSPIFQPGLLDGGDPTTDQIATLERFIPLKADEANAVDCALAALVDANFVSSTILPKVGRLKSAEPIDAAEGMRVEKTGRATGYTTGSVFEVAYTGKVQFELGMLTFENQVLIRGDQGAFSNGGDSGSLVVDCETGRATGLLFGGVSQFDKATGLLLGGVPPFTIANHLSDVLETLNVRLVA